MSDLLYIAICDLGDLPPGERLFIKVGDIPIVIINQDGEYYAIDDCCTHDDGPLGDGEVENHEITCPRHGARFDIRTGEVLSLPAVKGVRSFPLRVNGDQLEMGLEIE